MSEISIQNDVNIKDEKRLINAGFKLTPNSKAEKFTFDTKAIPSLMCGIEETTTFSLIDLITCIRDISGNNRLCVDIVHPPKDIFTFNATAQLTANTLTLGGDSNKDLFITGFVVFNHNAAASFAFTLREKTLNNVLFTGIVPKDNFLSIISSLPVLQLSKGKLLEFSSINPGSTYDINIWGYYQ